MDNNIVDCKQTKNILNGISKSFVLHVSEKLQNTAELDVSQKTLKDIDEIRETTDKNELEATKDILNGLSKFDFHISEDFQNITEIDFSKKNLEKIDKGTTLPPCLRCLNLSHNKLLEVPKIVMDLKQLQVLDISHNAIQYFNETPSFCHEIENLNVSSNDLRCPPIWIWLEFPRNLSRLDISCNMHIAELLNGYVDELLQYNTRLTHVTLYNCRLGKYLRFLGTFPNAKDLVLGTPDWSCYAANHLQELPCQGLNKCCDIQRLILTNTHIYTITPQINMFKNLIEINLSQNNLNGLPTEFCELENLEICILSFNNILYVPDDIVKLKKLTTLCLAVNELCMIPENIMDLTNLKVLDLYDNNISEYPEDIRNIPELDLAQNYFEEPDDDDYLEKRGKLRLHNSDRLNGRKFEMEQPESEHSPDTTDDEELIRSLNEKSSSDGEPKNAPPSSPEDWDSDSYWEPYNVQYQRPKGKPYWTSFVKKAMDNGNLCPSDHHTAPVMCRPTQEYESDGQFDDYSEDDS
ncbi:leucine-rich repeat protein SHOC-2-like [Cydia splendana]|uniref:leucine-rich repeat protein SHOC-2-like n=1 Tax=Cydia splendana TaxID=1100963 RepID=UPI00300CFEC1